MTKRNDSREGGQSRTPWGALALYAAAGWAAAEVLLAVAGGCVVCLLLLMAIAMPVLAVLASSAGWIFTEIGRQPWIVFGLMGTAAGVSPGVPATTVLLSLIVFTLVYATLAVIEVGLLVRAIRIGPPERVEDPFAVPADTDADRPLTFAY